MDEIRETLGRGLLVGALVVRPARIWEKVRWVG